MSASPLLSYSVLSPYSVMKGLILLLIPPRDGWMHSTCFLQSSCVCTSCPLPFLSIAPSHFTCCGCRVRLSALEAFSYFKQSNYTHIYTHNQQLKRREESQCFGFGLFEGGLSSHGDLTEVLVFSSVLQSNAVRDYCGYFPASG